MKRISVIGTAALFLVVGAIAPAYAQKDDHKDGGKPAQEQQKQQGKPEQGHEQQAKPAQEQQQHAAQPQQSRPAQQQRAQQTPQAAPAQRQQQAQQSKPTQQQHTQQAQQSRPAQQQRTQQAQPALQQRTQQVQQSRPAQQQQQRQQQDARSAQLRNPVQVRQEQAAWKGDRANNWKSDHRTWQQRGGYNGYRVPDSSFRAYYGVSHEFRIYSLPVVFVGGQQRFQYGGVWFGLVDPWPEYWSSNWYDDDDVYVDFYDGGYYLTDRRYPSDRIAVSFYLN